MAWGAGEYICPCGHGLFAGRGDVRRGLCWVWEDSQSFFHCERGRNGGVSIGDEVLRGLALAHSPFCATADVGSLVASGMDDEGLSARRRTFGSWCASGMGFCCRSDGGLGSEDKGTRVEAPCGGAKRGLGLCWSRVTSGLVLRILRCCFRFVVRYFI